MAYDLSGSGQFLTAATGFGLAATDPWWAVVRGWLDVTSDAVLLRLGVSGTGNNSRSLQQQNGQLRAHVQQNNAVQGWAGQPWTTTGTWFVAVGEWASPTARAITVDTLPRVVDATSRPLTLAPTLLTIAASTQGTTLLDGRLAYVALWRGIPTAGDRQAALSAISPELILPSTLLECWDFARRGLVGVRGTVLTPTGSPPRASAPRVSRPWRRGLVAVPRPAVTGTVTLTAPAARTTGLGAAVLTGTASVTAPAATAALVGAAVVTGHSAITAPAVTARVWGTLSGLGVVALTAPAATAHVFAWSPPAVEPPVVVLGACRAGVTRITARFGRVARGPVLRTHLTGSRA